MRAVVTGSARGIGFAIARRFAEEGARVAIADLDAEGASAAAETINEHCGRCAASAHELDVARADSVERLFSELDGLRILVNNAGIIRDGFAESISEEDWDRVLEVNLKGPFLACRAARRRLLEAGGGRIVNIGSRAWLGNIGQANYSASKAGLVGLTRTLALEWARDGIAVNLVAPGLIDTPLTRGLPEKVRQRLIRAQPGGDMGRPEDVAEAALFLADPAAGFVTGQVIHVCGGKSVGLTSL